VGENPRVRLGGSLSATLNDPREGLGAGARPLPHGSPLVFHWPRNPRRTKPVRVQGPLQFSNRQPCRDTAPRCFDVRRPSLSGGGALAAIGTGDVGHARLRVRGALAKTGDAQRMECPGVSHRLRLLLTGPRCSSTFRRSPDRLVVETPTEPQSDSNQRTLGQTMDIKRQSGFSPAPEAASSACHLPGCVAGVPLPGRHGWWSAASRDFNWAPVHGLVGGLDVLPEPGATRCNSLSCPWSSPNSFSPLPQGGRRGRKPPASASAHPSCFWVFSVSALS